MATNYKKLKWGTDTPDTVKWNTATPEYPGLVLWNGTPVFARAVDFDFTTKTGISSFTSKLMAYSVPSSVARDGYYFWGDKLTVTANLATWWTTTVNYVDFTVKDYIPLTNSYVGAVGVRYSFPVSRTPRNVTVNGIDVGDSHSASIYTQYRDLENLYKTLMVTGSEDVTAWAGGLVTVSIASTGLWYEERLLYDNIADVARGTSYTFAEGEDDINISAYPIPGARELTVNKTDKLNQLSAITATYTRVINPHTIDATTQATTIAVPTDTESSTYTNLYRNSSVNLTATLNSLNTAYMNLTITSVNSGASSDNCEFTIKATGKTRTLKYVQNGDSDAFNSRRLVYKDINGVVQTVTPTQSIAYTMWQGDVPVYNITGNTYYTVSITTEGWSKGSQTATLTAVGAAKERTLNIGAFAYGMSKFSWSTTSDSGSTAITTGTSATLKQPYTYNYSITTPSPDYFNITMSPTKNEPGDSTLNVSFSSTGKTRNYTVYWGDKITSVTGQYISGSWITTNYAPTVSGSGYKKYTDVWRGAGITVNATAATYYTPFYTTTHMDADVNDAACTISTVLTPRKLTFTTYSANLNSATVWYTDTSDTRVSSSVAGTFTDVWQGAAITYTATAASYYTTSIVSSNLGATTATIAVLTISATPADRDLTLDVNSTILGHNYINEITIRTGSSSGSIWLAPTFDEAAAIRTVSVPQPYSLYYSALANMDSYYTIELSATNSPRGDSALSLSANVVRMKRTLTVNINNRDKAAGSIIATYGSLATTTRVSTSFALSTTSTYSSTTIDIWQGGSVSYTRSLDTTNYEISWESSNTGIGAASATITATIYGRNLGHPLSVWPSGAASWYRSSSSGTTWVSPGTATSYLYASRYTTMAYAGTSATTCTVTVYRLAEQWTYQIKAATAGYRLLGLSPQPTVAPITATTFTAYIGRPVTLTLSGTPRVPYGFSANYTSYTYYPTSGVPSQAITSSIPSRPYPDSYNWLFNNWRVTRNTTTGDTTVTGKIVNNTSNTLVFTLNYEWDGTTYPFTVTVEANSTFNYNETQSVPTSLQNLILSVVPPRESTQVLVQYPSSSTGSIHSTYNVSSKVAVNGAQTTQFKFTRKSSYWTMIINNTTRSNQTYTYSSTYSTNTTVLIDAYRNSTTGMKYGDGWHAYNSIADTSDGQTAIGSATIYNDTSSNVTFTFRVTGYSSSGSFTSNLTTVTIAARSSAEVEVEYDTGGELDWFDFEGKSSYETTYEGLASW